MLASSFIPADVPLHARQEFRKNYTLLTRSTGNLFLFSADHKIEHLDQDFHGPNIDPAAHDPHHLFSLASQSPIGAMATQIGLIARYANQYPDITYVAKLNSKTNIIPREQKDPFSQLLWTVDDVLALKSTGLSIAGIGVTIYLGSDFEAAMLEQAAQAIFQAHQHGLVTILWAYPRGKAVADETDPYLLAGAVGVAASLGADFVKIHPPAIKNNTSYEEVLRFIVQAAGTTKVICAGGKFKDEKVLLENIKKQVTKGGIAGAAIGRSIFQHSLEDALTLTKALAQIIYGEKSS